MPQNSGALICPVSQDGDSPQRVVRHGGYRLRWCLFGGMGVFAMVIIVTGTETQGRGSWAWKYISSYIVWIALSVWFVYLNMEQRKEFVIRSLLYLASIGAVLYYFFGVLKISSESIPLYIPICTTVGIALAISLEYKWEQLKHSTQKFRRSIGNWLAVVIANTEVNSQALPQNTVRHPPEPPPPPRSQARPPVIGTSGQA